MTTVEARLRLGMDVATFMTAFHMGFLLLSLIGLFLITVRIIPFDFDASIAVMVAALLNVVFALLWALQISKKAPRKRAVSVSSVPVKTEHLSSMVSFVIVAHDDELAIASCIDGVFNAAAGYRGPSEVLVVDDGSSDGTFEAAWTALDSKKTELTGVPGRVVKHLAHLGLTESARTAVNRVFGEYVAFVDAKTVCEPLQLAGVVDRVYPSPKTLSDIQAGGGLYVAEALRQLLN